MSEKTKIDWCDSTINFVSGCEKVSPGCAHCYITSTVPFRVSGRKHGDDPVVHESAFALARRLNNKPWVCDKCGHSQQFENNMYENNGCEKCNSKTHRRRIFALSLSDFLWDRVSVGVWLRVMHTIWSCQDVDWLLCTKRTENWKPRMMKALDVITDGTGSNAQFWQWLVDWIGGKPPHNIWIGTTVENQAMADKRIPELLKIPAAVRFLSVEPLLEDINLALTQPVPIYDAEYGDQHEYAERKAIELVIVGGESGSLARPCNISWIRSVKDQCAEANVPCFVKQFGSFPTLSRDNTENYPAPMLKWYPCANNGSGGYRVILKHPKGGNMDEWPEDLRVREWPESRR